MDLTSWEGGETTPLCYNKNVCNVIPASKKSHEETNHGWRPPWQNILYRGVSKGFWGGTIPADSHMTVWENTRGKRFTGRHAGKGIKLGDGNKLGCVRATTRPAWLEQSQWAQNGKSKGKEVCRGPHHAGLCRLVRSAHCVWVVKVLRKPLGNSELRGDMIRFNILNSQVAWLDEGNKDPE